MNSKSKITNWYYPAASTLLEAILKDSAYKFLDNINTARKKPCDDDVTLAFKKAVGNCKIAERKEDCNGQNIRARGSLIWRADCHSANGYSSLAEVHNCINAARNDHGPSWRMVVQLTEKTEAYGIYPGGQSGNPGSIIL